MTRAQLLYLTREIESGRPLWSLLRANEWMGSSHPIRREIARRAGSLLRGRIPSATLTALIEGETLTSLDAATQSMLRKHIETPLRFVKHIPSDRALSQSLLKRGEERRSQPFRTAEPRKVRP